MSGGEIKTPTEFGAKLDLSIDSWGYGRIEKISFEAYNESGCLQEAAERYKERTGHYPKRILAGQIYRTRENRQFCKNNGIRLSGPKLGRPSEEKNKQRKERQIEYQDNTDRIEVERAFSLSKRCYGMGLIVTKLKETQLTSIALSVFVMNLFKISSEYFMSLFTCPILRTDIGRKICNFQLNQQTLISIVLINITCYMQNMQLSDLVGYSVNRYIYSLKVYIIQFGLSCILILWVWGIIYWIIKTTSPKLSMSK